jgi:hypothetical protein
VSAWAVVSLLVGTAGVCLSAYGNNDPDLYWHRVLGEQWLTHHSLALDPDPIAFTPGRDWFPTAWAMEAVYAALTSVAGYSGVTSLRFLLAVAFYLALARYLFGVASPRTAALVLAAVGLPASLAVQDRPQTVSLVLCTLILGAIHRALKADVLPRWWIVVLVTWVWANLHGLWIIVPGLLALLALIRALERSARWREPALLAAAAVLAAALTPVGPRLLTAPLLLSSATPQIAEWAPTSLRSPSGWGLGAALGLVLVCALAGYRADRRRIVYVVALAVFGFWAFRNAVFASVLLCLVLVEAIETVAAKGSDVLVPRRLALALLPMLLLTALATYHLHAGIPGTMPRKIAAALDAMPRPVRVVTEYNVSGFLREFGGDRVRVSIDGRSDRYGARTIRVHGRMLDGERGWRRDLDTLRPDVVVVGKDSALRELLADGGWRVTVIDHEYAMLIR